MSKSIEELKSIMIVCYKCGWSYSSRKEACPMCGAEIVLGKKELSNILMQYIERQGHWNTEKECEKFVKEFKKKNKRMPNLEDLWKAAVDFSKMQMMDKTEIKKMKEKQDLELKAQMEKLKEKKLAEKKTKKQKIGEEQESSIDERQKRLEELQKRRMESGAGVNNSFGRSLSTESKGPEISSPNRVSGSKPFVNSNSEEDVLICPNCGKKNPPGSKFCLEDGTPL